MKRSADVIQRLRVERGLSRAQACALGDLSQATWGKVESGCTANPRPDSKRKIARALGVSPSRIWPLRPDPLHLENVDDPRWETAVRAMAQRLDREGSFEERQAFGRRLVAVLDYADGGSSDPERDPDRWEEFWRLGDSLMFDPQNTPIAIINGRCVDRDLDCLTPTTRARAVPTAGLVPIPVCGNDQNAAASMM
jgi:transcriptional regulator with XRE-family HTH domain